VANVRFDLSLSWFELSLLGVGVASVCHVWWRPDASQFFESVNEVHEGGFRALRHSVSITRTINVWLQHAGMFVYMMTNSALIPLSYDITQKLGGGATLSGLLVGMMYVSTPLGFLIARVVMRMGSQPFKRGFTSSCFLCISVATLCTAVVVSPTCSYLDKSTRLIILFTARAVLGLLAAGVASRRMMMQSILPTGQNIGFNLGCNVALALGIGAGPPAVSFISWMFDSHDTGIRDALALRLIAVVCFLVACLWWALTPNDLEELLDARRAEDANETQPSTTSKISPPTKRNHQLWITALMLGTERATTISALEVATALLLEVEYGLSISAIGYIVGVAFVLGLPIVFVLDRFRHSAYISTETLLVVFMGTCAMATPFLFTGTSSFLHQLLKVPRWTPLFFADALIFPAAFAMSGLADAIAMNESDLDSIYNQENYIFASGVLQSLARGIGSPAARYLVYTGGQNVYASVQALFIGLALVKALGMRCCAAPTIREETSKC